MKLFEELVKTSHGGNPKHLDERLNMLKNIHAGIDITNVDLIPAGTTMDDFPEAMTPTTSACDSPKRRDSDETAHSSRVNGTFRSPVQPAGPMGPMGLPMGAMGSDFI